MITTNSSSSFLQLLDACVSNCGLSFHLEVCSREFENFLIQVLSKGHPIVIEKLKEYIKRWSEQEFRDNPQLSLIPSLYNRLKKEGVKFRTADAPKREMKLPTDPNVVTSNQEEEDIAKAIELSLKETTSPKSYNNKSSSSLYPSIMNGSYSAAASSAGNQQQPAKETYKVRTLYDFEAAEDNEITFKAGEILLVLDDSDSNWWKGSNHRGEGLFPSNFVTKNLDQEIESAKPAEKKSVQFNEEVRVKLLSTETVTEIEDAKIDRLLYLLHEADPTGERPDSDELIQLEEQCLKMGPLIDQELEVVDKTHASLSAVNSQLVEALNIYCALMKEDSTYSTIPQQSPYAMQQPPTSFSGPAMNPPHIGYAQPPPPQLQSPAQPPTGLPYSSPYHASVPGSMTPANVPYNHIYSSTSNANPTTSTYTINQVHHYGDPNSQQMMQQQQQHHHPQAVDPNTSQPMVNQMTYQDGYQQQQPATSMALPTNQ